MAGIISVTACEQPPPIPASAHMLPSNNLGRWAAKGFSQFGADGVIHKIFGDIGTTNKFYVEFGTQAGDECNSRRLREVCGWHGLMMDGGFDNMAIGQHQHFLTRENIGSLFQKYAVPKDPDLLSVDIDGNDFHVLAAILQHRYRPRVIIVETNFWLSETIDAVIAYEPSHLWPGMHSCYNSASVAAYRHLSRKYGYSMVLGMAPDLYWVRDDVLRETVGLSAYDTTNNVSALIRQANPFAAHQKAKQRDCWNEYVKRGHVNSTTAMAHVRDMLSRRERPGASLTTPLRVRA